MLSADDIFYVSAILFIGLTCLIWLARPEPAGGGSSSAVASGAH